MHVDKISRPYMRSRRTTKAKNKNFICINVYYYYYKVGGKGGGGGGIAIPFQVLVSRSFTHHECLNSRKFHASQISQTEKKDVLGFC